MANKLSSINRILLILSLSFISYSNYGVWVKRASMPVSFGRTGSTSFVIDTSMFVVGGYNSNGVEIGDCWRYNSNSNTWTQRASHPSNAIVNASSLVYNGIGYLVCGKSNSSYSNKVYAYINATNSWILKSNFPGSARYTGSSFVIGNKGFFGLGYSPINGDFYSYNFSNDTWSACPNLPGSPRQSAAAFSLNGRGFIACGSYTVGSSYTGLNDLWEYEPNLKVWTQKSAFPSNPRWGCIVFVRDNCAYLGAGISYTSSSSPVTSYQDIWKYNPISNDWIFYNDFPTKRGSTISENINGNVYAGFGMNNLTVYNDLYLDSIASNTNTNDEPVFGFDILHNTAHNQLEINIFGVLDGSPIKLEIHNLAGQLVQNMDLASEIKLFIDVTPLASSVYLCTITDLRNGNMLSKKFLKN